MHRHPVLQKIISGGQTGADRAALDFAIEHQIPHGGWCPQGRMAEDGTIEIRYRLKETPSPGYIERTEWNVRDSDGTIIFSQGNLLGGGSRLTAEFAKKHQKPWLHIAKDQHAQAAELIEKFIIGQQVHILNVAGPRVATDPEIVGFTKTALKAWWKITLLALFFLCCPGLLFAEQKAPTLSPLLLTTNRSDWDSRRNELKTEWLKFLGGLPAHHPPLKTEFGQKEELPQFSRQYVRYQVEDGLYTDGYLLTPAKHTGKLPAMVVFHPTTPLQARGVAGLEPSYQEEKWQGVQLAQHGYVAWCPRNYINTDGTNWSGNAKIVLAKHPHWTGMTRMVWDAIRAADFVESLPEVDANRIGCIGHSLGGKEVLYAPAFDERYRVSVSCEGGIGLKFSNWDAVWYLGSRIKQPNFKLENHQVLALIAPRPFLLLAGDSADGEKSGAFIAAVKPVYALSGATHEIAWFNHHLGHRYPPEGRKVAEEFLDKYLK